MKIMTSDKSRHLIFITLVAVIIISLFVINNLGKKQDKAFAEESNQYHYALQLLSENKTAEAEPILSKLAKRHQDNDEILWRYGVVQSQMQKYKQAQVLFQKAQDQNVLLVKNPIFLAQYGEVLFKLGEEDKAKVYLQESLKQNQNQEITKAVNTMLEHIEKKDQQ